MTLQEWINEHFKEITEVQTLLNAPISDDMNIMRDQLIRIEAWYSRIGKLLADVGKLLSDTRELKDRTLISETRRLRDIIAAQLEHIDKRISVCQSLLKLHIEERKHEYTQGTKGG